MHYAAVPHPPDGGRMSAGTLDAVERTPEQHQPSWGKVLSPYTQSDIRRSVLDVLTSAVAYLVFSAGMYFALDVSYWLVLALALPTAGFLLRTYIMFHDCTHGSLWPSKR